MKTGQKRKESFSLHLDYGQVVQLNSLGLAEIGSEGYELKKYGRVVQLDSLGLAEIGSEGYELKKYGRVVQLDRISDFGSEG